MLNNLKKYDDNYVKQICKMTRIIFRYKRKEEKLIEVIDSLVELINKGTHDTNVIDAVIKIRNDVYELTNLPIDENCEINIDKTAFKV